MFSIVSEGSVKKGSRGLARHVSGVLEIIAGQEVGGLLDMSM